MAPLSNSRLNSQDLQNYFFGKSSIWKTGILTSSLKSLIRSKESLTRIKQSSGRKTSSMYSEIYKEIMQRLQQALLQMQFCIGKNNCESQPTSPSRVFSILPLTKRAKSGSLSTSRCAVIMGVLHMREAKHYRCTDSLYFIFTSIILNSA